MRHVILSLESTRALAALLSGHDAALDGRFVHALDLAHALDDPTLAKVGDLMTRIEVEQLAQSIGFIRDDIALNLGPTLGVAAGFNALDGD